MIRQQQHQGRGSSGAYKGELFLETSYVHMHTYIWCGGGALKNSDKAVLTFDLRLQQTGHGAQLLRARLRFEGLQVQALYWSSHC